jgi:hypothetical protein
LTSWSVLEEKKARMRYERPTIIRRERIEALLFDSTKSEKTFSDVHRKENIRPVIWPVIWPVMREARRERYAAPAIDRREPIAGLLNVAKSEKTISDVHRKENVRPVTWVARRERYAAPAIDRREPIAGLLTVAKSEKANDTFTSDVHSKDKVVPVLWGSTPPVAYTPPGVARREPLTALLDTVTSDNLKDLSDRNVKDNIVPVRW